MFDEMMGKDGARAPYHAVARWLETVGADALELKRLEAETLFRRIGITFAVYGEGGDPERLIPFDLIPRVFAAEEWRTLSRGITQRARALNAFLHDVYHRGEILKAGVIPETLVFRNDAFLPEMVGVDPPGKIYSHIVGIDIVRTGPDDFMVLEDNCRTPSGVSYMLENREIMMRMFPELFAGGRVLPVDNYPDMLRATLEDVAPKACRQDPTCVVLTPGPLNSAYYEHSFLADQMGVELVESRDLFVDEGLVWMRTTQGPRRVDVIYRRIDDDFIDPLVFRKDSVLGVPGLMGAYKAGNVGLANAVGTGVADDKAIYHFVPKMIEFYLSQQPILPNVPTYLAVDDDDRAYILNHLPELVVKATNESGGYGMLMGPSASKKEIEEFRTKIIEDPGNFIAQPVLALSRCPTWTENGMEGRHIDLRPYIIYGRDIKIVPGGLTRVALKKGSLVVNSSQGGGSKDTWVLSH